jgi:hypothetical protein
MLSDEQRDKVKDIARLIAPESDRRAFLELLESKLRGREFTDSELRHIAEDTWREFLRRGGWDSSCSAP